MYILLLRFVKFLSCNLIFYFLNSYLYKNHLSVYIRQIHRSLPVHIFKTLIYQAIFATQARPV